MSPSIYDATIKVAISSRYTERYRITFMYVAIQTRRKADLSSKGQRVELDPDALFIITFHIQGIQGKMCGIQQYDC